MTGRAPERYDVQDVDMSWHDRAACNPLNNPDVRPEWFSAVDPLRERVRAPHGLPRIEQALAVCRRCPVTEQCLRQGLEDKHAIGVYGGRYIGWGERPSAR